MAFGENLDGIGSFEKIEVVEIEEMHTYAGGEKLCLNLDCC